LLRALSPLHLLWTEQLATFINVSNVKAMSIIKPRLLVVAPATVAFLVGLTALYLSAQPRSSPQAYLCTNSAFDEGSTIAPPEVQEAARKGLDRFLKAIPPQQLLRFNFLNQEELNKATLGTPFREFTTKR
jgi:hypothetical protein